VTYQYSRADGKAPHWRFCYVLHRVKVIPLVWAASVFLFSTASFGAGALATSGLTTGELTRLEKGGVVLKTKDHHIADGTSSARIRAYCVINRPPDAVWAIMLNYQKFAEFMPRLEKVEVLEKTQGTMKVTETVHVPLGVISYTIDLIFTPAQRTVSWTMDKSRQHDIADTSGIWEFLPYSQGRTMLRYSTTVDSGMFVPRFLEDAMIKQDLSDALLGLKRRTESDGTWKKK
jgi:carbon monoxide dehydrogenase subunit G